jgi:hypothetical protein
VFFIFCFKDLVFLLDEVFDFLCNRVGSRPRFFLFFLSYFYLTTIGLNDFLYRGDIDLPGLENGDSFNASILSRQSLLDE